MGTIRQWLEQVGLPQYAEAFERNAIDLEVAQDLADQDLKDLGIDALGHRKMLLRGIAKLNEAGPAAAALASTQPLPSARSVSAEAERRQLTVMFCDLAGSTELATNLDPEALRDLMQVYQRTCAEVIARYEGHVAQYLGDGLMVYFGWPRAHEDDAARAIRAGLEVTHAVSQLNASRPLRARVGIHTGLVVVGETGQGDASIPKAAVGETPNTAARLQALAEPGSVVVSERTRSLAGGLFEYMDLGPRTLKGVGEPVHVQAVLRTRAIDSRFEATHGELPLCPLVGREEEIALLLRRWRQAKEGEGQVVQVSGEAGVGKSRLAWGLSERLSDERYTVVRYQCSPYHVNSALHPAIEQFERAAGFAREDSFEQKLDKMEAHLARKDSQLAASAPLFAALLSLPAERYRPLNISPQKQKESTLEALVGEVEALAQRQPVLMIYEDAHWIDATSQEALDLLVPRLRDLRVLMIVTYRPEYSAHWTDQAHVSSLGLNRLGRRQSAELVDKIASGKALPQEVLDQVVAHADGVPLFVEELTKSMLESKLLREESDRFLLDGPLPALAIPTTLRDSLIARLDRLAPVREVAQIGACIGREFAYELLAAVSPVKGAKLDEALEQLAGSGLVFRRGTPPDATYTFKHALVQDAAHDLLLRSKRAQLHAQIAKALEQDFFGQVEKAPEILAHHYTEAGLVAQATAWWQRAGQRAVERSAHMEAINHLTKGLELAATLPATHERAEQELLLLNPLGLALFAVKGQASEEVGRTYRRAREICCDVDDTAQAFAALGGLFSFHVVRAELAAAWKVAEQLRDLAQRQQDRARLLTAHLTLGETLLFEGKFVQARAHLEQGVALYTPELSQPLKTGTGFPVDLGVFQLCFLAHTLWHLGYPDQAHATMQQALTVANALADPFSVAVARDYEAMLYQFRGETSRVGDSSAVAILLCKEQGFAYYLAWGSFMQGWMLQERGQDQAGVDQMRHSLAAIRATGAALRQPYYMRLLAEACGKAGRIDDALAFLDEALACVDRTGERWDEAELHRVKGELLLNHTSRGEAVEESISRALDIARAQGARALELRATVSLGRLWQRHGKGMQARQRVTEIYNWFTEGFDTADLQAARALLDSLQ